MNTAAPLSASGGASSLAANPALVQDSYHNISNLQQLKSLDQHASLDAVSRQFESLLLHQMLKSMRSANAVWSEDSMLSSPRVDFYQQMLDDQMSLEMTRGDGLGFARTIREQLGGGTIQSSDDAPAGAYESHDSNDTRINPVHVSTVRAVSALTAQTDNTGKNDNFSPVDLKTASIADDELRAETFVQQVHPFAERAARRLGVDPAQIIAQAALETGWGEHVIRHTDGSSSHNLFGIKADSRWQGDSVSTLTHEYFDNRKIAVNAQFRSYDSLEQAFEDYVNFLVEQPRYEAIHNSATGFASALQLAGYATDPAYASKIEKISQRINGDAGYLSSMDGLSAGPVAGRGI